MNRGPRTAASLAIGHSTVVTRTVVQHRLCFGRSIGVSPPPPAGRPASSDSPAPCRGHSASVRSSERRPQPVRVAPGESSCEREGKWRGEWEAIASGDAQADDREI